MGSARNILIAQAAAIVGIGGGAGTQTELAIAWEHRRPVVAFQNLGGYAGQIAGTALDRRGAPDRVVIAVSSAAAAIEALREAGVLPRHGALHFSARANSNREYECLPRGLFKSGRWLPVFCC